MKIINVLNESQSFDYHFMNYYIESFRKVLKISNITLSELNYALCALNTPHQNIRREAPDGTFVESPQYHINDINARLNSTGFIDKLKKFILDGRDFAKLAAMHSQTNTNKPVHRTPKPRRKTWQDMAEERAIEIEEQRKQEKYQRKYEADKEQKRMSDLLIYLDNYAPEDDD